MPGDEKGPVVMRLPCLEREDAEEFIDQPDTSLEDIRATLRDQALVNRWLGGASATMIHLLPVLRSSASNPARILDAACGGGDLARRIVDEARALGKQVEMVGLDLNERTIQCAREQCRDYPEITLVRGDALDPQFGPGEFDIVVMATFLHHLAPDTVVKALGAAKRLSAGAVIAADLVRSPLAYLGIHVFAKLARFHPISAHDGAVSVCRAYTPPELAEFARRAGLERSRVFRHRFYRMTLVYEHSKEVGSGD